MEREREREGGRERERERAGGREEAEQEERGGVAGDGPQLWGVFLSPSLSPPTHLGDDGRVPGAIVRPQDEDLERGWGVCERGERRW